MFDVGFWEVSLIAIVALVVVGPERLPSLVNEAGKWAGRARATARDLKYDLQHQAEIDELAKLGQDIKESADDVNPANMRTNLRDMLADLESRSEPLDDDEEDEIYNRAVSQDDTVDTADAELDRETTTQESDLDRSA
ncbi:MAG: Sec-independent protein translocase protein TatB [Pseudomonadota bacterium]